MATTQERVSSLEEYSRTSEKRLDNIDSNVSALRRDLWIGFGILTTIMSSGFMAILTILN